jgi:hypothetical protein
MPLFIGKERDRPPQLIPWLTCGDCIPRTNDTIIMRPLRDYISGGVNLVADVTTQLWELTDCVLIARFELAFSQTLP